MGGRQFKKSKGHSAATPTLGPITTYSPASAKPVDRWLARGGVAVGIALYLVPKSGPFVVGLLFLMGILLLHPLWNFWWIEKSLTRRIVAVVVLVAALSAIGRISLGSFATTAKTPGPPAPPTMLAVTTQFKTAFKDLETPISVSQASTPCTLKGGKAYPLNNLSSMPGGPSSKRPWLLPKPERLLLKSKGWVSGGASNETYDLFLEVSVTSRGEASVAKDWRLCLVSNGKPFRYRPEEMSASDMETFENKVSLEQASMNTPIERGHALIGWLLFRVPKTVVGNELVGSFECRDYLEHRYSISFGSSSVSPSLNQ